MSSNSPVCRLCLGIITEEKTFYNIDDENGLPVQNVRNIREMINFCVPEMDTYISINPSICNTCLDILTNIYNNKKRFMKVEDIIRCYSVANNLMDGSCVDLCNVVKQQFTLALKKKKFSPDVIKKYVDDVDKCFQNSKKTVPPEVLKIMAQKFSSSGPAQPSVKHIPSPNVTLTRISGNNPVNNSRLRRLLSCTVPAGPPPRYAPPLNSPNRQKQLPPKKYVTIKKKLIPPKSSFVLRNNMSSLLAASTSSPQPTIDLENPQNSFLGSLNLVSTSNQLLCPKTGVMTEIAKKKPVIKIFRKKPGPRCKTKPFELHNDTVIILDDDDDDTPECSKKDGESTHRSTKKNYKKKNYKTGSKSDDDEVFIMNFDESEDVVGQENDNDTSSMDSDANITHLVADASLTSTADVNPVTKAVCANPPVADTSTAASANETTACPKPFTSVTKATSTAMTKTSTRIANTTTAEVIVLDEPFKPISSPLVIEPEKLNNSEKLLPIGPETHKRKLTDDHVIEEILSKRKKLYVKLNPSLPYLHKHKRLIVKVSKKSFVKCQFCYFVSKGGNKEIKQHCLNNHKLCMLCDYPCKNKTLLDKHISNHHLAEIALIIDALDKDDNRQLKCDFCPFVTTSSFDIRDHVIKKHCGGYGKTEYDCPFEDCALKFTHSSHVAYNVARHVEQHILAKKLTCVVCNQKTNRKSTLRIHLKSHMACKIVCPLCGLGFSTNISLKNHRKKKHPNIDTESNIAGMVHDNHENLIADDDGRITLDSLINRDTPRGTLTTDENGRIILDIPRPNPLLSDPNVVINLEERCSFDHPSLSEMLCQSTFEEEEYLEDDCTFAGELAKPKPAPKSRKMKGKNVILNKYNKKRKIVKAAKDDPNDCMIIESEVFTVDVSDEDTKSAISLPDSSDEDCTVIEESKSESNSNSEQIIEKGAADSTTDEPSGGTSKNTTLNDDNNMIISDSENPEVFAKLLDVAINVNAAENSKKVKNYSKEIPSYEDNQIKEKENADSTTEKFIPEVNKNEEQEAVSDKALEIEEIASNSSVAASSNEPPKSFDNLDSTIFSEKDEVYTESAACNSNELLIEKVTSENLESKGSPEKNPVVVKSNNSNIPDNSEKIDKSICFIEQLTENVSKTSENIDETISSLNELLREKVSEKFDNIESQDSSNLSATSEKHDKSTSLHEFLRENVSENSEKSSKKVDESTCFIETSEKSLEKIDNSTCLNELLKEYVSEKANESIFSTDLLRKKVSETSDKIDELISCSNELLGEKFSQKSDNIESQDSSNLSATSEKHDKSTSLHEFLRENVSENSEKSTKKVDESTCLTETSEKSLEKIDNSTCLNELLEEYVSEKTNESIFSNDLLRKKVSKTSDKIDELISCSNELLGAKFSQKSDNIELQDSSNLSATSEKHDKSTSLHEFLRENVSENSEKSSKKVDESTCLTETSEKSLEKIDNSTCLNELLEEYVSEKTNESIFSNDLLRKKVSETSDKIDELISCSNELLGEKFSQKSDNIELQDSSNLSATSEKHDKSTSLHEFLRENVSENSEKSTKKVDESTCLTETSEKSLEKIDNSTCLNELLEEYVSEKTNESIFSNDLLRKKVSKTSDKIDELISCSNELLGAKFSQKSDNIELQDSSNLSATSEKHDKSTSLHEFLRENVSENSEKSSKKVDESTCLTETSEKSTCLNELLKEYVSEKTNGSVCSNELLRENVSETSDKIDELTSCSSELLGEKVSEKSDHIESPSNVSSASGKGNELGEKISQVLEKSSGKIDESTSSNELFLRENVFKKLKITSEKADEYTCSNELLKESISETSGKSLEKFDDSTCLNEILRENVSESLEKVDEPISSSNELLKEKLSEKSDNIESDTSSLENDFIINDTCDESTMKKVCGIFEDLEEFTESSTTANELEKVIDNLKSSSESTESTKEVVHGIFDNSDTENLLVYEEFMNEILNGKTELTNTNSNELLEYKDIQNSNNLNSDQMNADSVEALREILEGSTSFVVESENSLN